MLYVLFGHIIILHCWNLSWIKQNWSISRHNSKHSRQPESFSLQQMFCKSFNSLIFYWVTINKQLLNYCLYLLISGTFHTTLKLLMIVNRCFSLDLCVNRSLYLFHQILFLVPIVLQIPSLPVSFSPSLVALSIFLFRWHTIPPVSCSWPIPLEFYPHSSVPAAWSHPVPLYVHNLGYVLAHGAVGCVDMCRCSTPETPGWFLCFWNAHSHGNDIQQAYQILSRPLRKCYSVNPDSSWTHAFPNTRI